MRHDKDNVFAEFSDWLDTYYNGVRRREYLSAHEQAVAQDAWNAGWESGHHEGHVDGYRLAEAEGVALRKDQGVTHASDLQRTA